ncbi:hypothetical protein LWI29_032441 [Acer saccharum]|uniref:Uncharacterized protein n=1 Tax=Acer saccharum TaxID=4024 RepID=A0AA39SVS9_ACESA|nr:hypothetical protein LWI29_032441 [Acer saccharum]
METDGGNRHRSEEIEVGSMQIVEDMRWVNADRRRSNFSMSDLLQTEDIDEPEATATVGINALSGELPKELGNLIDMRSFAIGSNNFSGPLPSGLGNWTKLEQLYIDSSGVSGEIPSTFAKLQNLATVWASDTELTGRIPDFIGNWSKLTSL